MKKNSSSANSETHESPSIDSTSVQNEKTLGKHSQNQKWFNAVQNGAPGWTVLATSALYKMGTATSWKLTSVQNAYDFGTQRPSQCTGNSTGGGLKI